MKRNRIRKPSAILVAVAAISLLFWEAETWACGDKFLVVGRGVRFERAYASKFPASILIFADDTEPRKELQSLLKKAGHRIQAFGNEKQLEEGLKKRKYDVALVSMAKLLMLEARIQSMSSQPFILPFLYESGGEAIPPKEYRCILKSENKSSEVLQTIDGIMESKLKSRPLNCEKILK